MTSNEQSRYVKATIMKCSLCGNEKVNCPKCGKSWNWDKERVSDRVQCPFCRRFSTIDRTIKKRITNKDATNGLVQGKIMNIVDIEGMKPFGENKFFGDSILHILNDDELVLKLNDVCEKEKQKPEQVIRKAVRKYLGVEK